MQSILLVLLTITFLASFSIIFFMYRKLQFKKGEKEQENMFLMLQGQMKELVDAFDSKMVETHKTMNTAQQSINKTLQEQFGQSSRLIQGITGQSHKMIAEITEKLTSLDKTNQQVVNFSEQLSNLERVLRSQKQRGALGEAGLQLVLENILPPNAFSLQFSFNDGDTVDAVIRTKEGIIPIDAKFSLENYQKLLDEQDKDRRAVLEKEFKNDLKRRIDETAKYIKPKEGTLDFAFMFIPSEAIYYDLLVNEVGAVKVNTRSLIDYAFNDRRVIIVSPTTFAAYLQTVLQGLRALKIEEGAKSIRRNVEMLGKHIKAYEDYMKKIGMSLGTTVNHYNLAYKELGKIDKDVVRITEGERSVEPELLDKPKLESESF